MFSTGVPDVSGVSMSGGVYDLSLFHDEQGRAAIVGYNVSREGAGGSPSRHMVLWTGTKVHGRSSAAYQEAALVLEHGLRSVFAVAAGEIAAQAEAAGALPAGPQGTSCPGVPGDAPELLPGTAG